MNKAMKAKVDKVRELADFLEQLERPVIRILGSLSFFWILFWLFFVKSC